MDRQYDPSDLGLSRLPDDDNPTPINPLSAPEPAPRRPASAAQRRAIIDGVCLGQGWRTSRRGQLGVACPCGAGEGAWCRRPGRGNVVGFLHPSRGVTPRGVSATA